MTNIRAVWKGARDTLRGFFAHQGFFLAAGISFYVIICLVPYLFLLIALAGFLLSAEMASQEVIAQLTEIVPVYQAEIEELLHSIVLARGVSGIIGTLILLLFTSQLFAALRFVLNRVLGETKGRGYVRGALFDLGMIVLSNLLFLATLGVTAVIAWLKVLLGVLRDPSAFLRVVELAGLGAAMVFSIALFFLLYRFVPSRRIPTLRALRAGAFAAILWEVAKQLFRWYVTGVGIYGQVYGPLGVLVALFMWIYYSAIVFVLGAEMIRAGMRTHVDA